MPLVHPFISQGFLLFILLKKDLFRANSWHSLAVKLLPEKSDSPLVKGNRPIDSESGSGSASRSADSNEESRRTPCWWKKAPRQSLPKPWLQQMSYMYRHWNKERRSKIYVFLRTCYQSETWINRYLRKVKFFRDPNINFNFARIPWMMPGSLGIPQGHFGLKYIPTLWLQMKYKKDWGEAASCKYYLYGWISDLDISKSNGQAKEFELSKN